MHGSRIPWLITSFLFDIVETVRLVTRAVAVFGLNSITSMISIPCFLRQLSPVQMLAALASFLHKNFDGLKCLTIGYIVWIRWFREGSFPVMVLLIHRLGQGLWWFSLFVELVRIFRRSKTRKHQWSNLVRTKVFLERSREWPKLPKRRGPYVEHMLKYHPLLVTDRWLIVTRRDDR